MSDIGKTRCPRCGNENPTESFACSFCGKRLRIERIENIRFFRRYEAEEWNNPYPWYYRIFLLLTNPSEGFWDINHRRKSAPGYLILLFNSLLYGLIGLAFFARVGIPNLGFFSPNLFLYSLSFYLTFLIFGLIVNFIFYSFLIWIFSKGANYAVDFSRRLEARFGEGQRDIEFSEEKLSPFSIYKGGVLLQKQEAYKFRTLLCAFSPFLIINPIKALIVLIAVPTVNVNVNNALDPSIFAAVFASPVWSVLDFIDALIIAGWVPLLMALSIRELANSSTYRVLISSYVVGIISAIVFYFLRPTLFG